jgi:PncC family amidohydrolase
VNAADREILYVAERIGRRLLQRGQFVTTAESCTGGWVAKALTDVAGSSGWFGEGFVTYSNEAKMRTLAVSRAVLKREGAVSEAVARAMAAGALVRGRAGRYPESRWARYGSAGPRGADRGFTSESNASDSAATARLCGAVAYAGHWRGSWSDELRGSLF